MAKLVNRVIEGIVVLLILFFSLVIIRSYLPHQPALKAEVRGGLLFVSVRNEDQQDWHNVRVRLNDWYWCPSIAAIAQGQSGSVDPLRCKTAEGDRFPPTRKVTTVSVTAATATGDASAGFAFDR